MMSTALFASETSAMTTRHAPATNSRRGLSRTTRRPKEQTPREVQPFCGLQLPPRTTVMTSRRKFSDALEHGELVDSLRLDRIWPIEPLFLREDALSAADVAIKRAASEAADVWGLG